MKSDITIAAISTSYGRSAIGVIRVSGKNVTKIIETFIGKALPPRRAVNTTIKDELGNVLDDVIAIYYKSPNSYTGEDMLEIQCHGNPVILDNILSVICTKYASHSEPGQFTERAFVNNKIDLTITTIYINKFASRDQNVSSWLRKASNYQRNKQSSDPINKLLNELDICESDPHSTFNPNQDDLGEWFSGAPSWIKRS